MKLKLSPDVAALNPDLDSRIAALGNFPMWTTTLIPDQDYRSDLERQCVDNWIPGLQPIIWAYEPWTFPLVGFKYTPDFVLVLRDLRVVVVEVKGERRNRRATRIAFNSLAATYPTALFCWLERDGGVWKESWKNGRPQTQS